MKQIKTVDNFFNQPLKKTWAEFEFRKEQVDMSISVEQAFQKSQNLMVEAGTGVGKSLAYLLPAVFYSLSEQKTVVISTETKALQNQLINKDIPIAKKLLGIDFQAEIAMGSNNYVCKRKLNDVISRGNFNPEMTEHLPQFYQWLNMTKSGIRSEYTGFATFDFWVQITRESDNCLGRNCPNFSSSFYFLEKEKWRRANILIVNHHLLGSHIAGDFKILPEFSHIIVDEAHNFSEIIGKSFCSTVAYEDVQTVLSFIHNDKSKNCLTTKIDTHKSKKDIVRFVAELERTLVDYFNVLTSELPPIYNAQRITESLTLDEGKLEEELNRLIICMAKTLEGFDKESDNLVEKEIAISLEMSIVRLQACCLTFSKFRLNEEEEMVAWVEPPNVYKQEKSFRLFTQPRNVTGIMEETFIPKMDSIIFTSATLTSGKTKFSYFKSYIGNIETQELVLESPFDYKNQVLLYIPKRISDPATQSDEYHEDLAKLIPMLLDLTEGSAFVLFTSNKSLNLVYDELVDNLPYPLFSQTKLGADKAKKEFLEVPNGVLFGVATFWQGVDIKGDQLKSVIITKLPFQPPQEPVLEARIEEIKKRNGNSFMEIQLPHSILTLKQGFGRLVRSKTDIGIVSILDPRLHTKAYGSEIVNALPPAKKVFTYKELKESYKQLRFDYDKSN
ncbi:MAG: DEAD/DEAH box helicase [Leptospiraceae bacterium]|nr:DEAD/DEAH box helicase [Leptospiraceae bacterium]